MNIQQSKRLLVIGPAWVGDMVMVQSLLISIKKENPNINIDVLAPDWSIGLIERMPEVSNGISMSVQHGSLGLKLRYKTGLNLRQNNYYRAIITPRSLKAALVPFFSKIPKRTGYLGEHRYGLINDIRPLDKKLLTQTVQRYVYLAAEEKTGDNLPVINFPRLEIRQSESERLVQKLNLNLKKPIVALLPGAEYGPAKQWPLRYFKELANKVVKMGFQVWVMGSTKDSVLGESIIKTEDSEHFNLCGKTTLVDVIDLLSLAKYAITNDSGLMHIACATDAKVIALYGSSSPLYTPPLHNDAIVLYKNLSCSPCFDRKCQFGHINCLNEISVNDVLEHVK